MNTPSQTPSNGLNLFEFQSNPLRVTADEQGKPWFIAKDVCAILGYDNLTKAIQEHCKTLTGVTTRYIPALLKRYRLIDEGNLFLLVANSGRLGDEVFEAWVRNEVLPSLHKTTLSQTPPQTPPVIHVADTDIVVITYQGHRVITTEVLTQVYDTEEIRIQQNFTRNKKHFEEGKHFFKLEGAELASLKIVSPQIDKRTRNLILWTERGAARHAKMLDTDKSWDVFNLLEDAYFQDTAQPRPLPEPPAKESSVTRLLVTMRYGQQPITETLSPNKHVLSLNDFTELARKTGFLVISKEELNRLFGSGHEI